MSTSRDLVRRIVRRRGSLAVGLLALAILAVPYLGYLGSHRLWPPYEPELVETTREMIVSGNHLVPRLNGQIFADKPPLYYWGALTATALRGRLDETAARLPSALSLLALVVVTAAFGTRLFGKRAGLLAGLALGTMSLSFQYGTMGATDMPLALTVTGAIALVYLATLEGQARGWALVLAAAVLGLSVMAKSLLGPVLVFLGTVPSIALAKDRRLPRPGWWVASAVVFFAASVPWFVAIYRDQGREFLLEVLVRQTFDRFLGRGDSKGNLLTYVVTMPADMLPWTLFLPFAALQARRARAGDPDRWRKLRFLLLGIGIELAFLSVSACRINKYVLPLLPQVALWIGAAADARTDDLGRRLVRIPALGLAALLATGALVGPLVAIRWFPAFALVGAVGSGVAVLAAFALFTLARRAGPATILLGLACVLASVLVFAEAWIYPVVNAIRTDQPLEEIIVRNVEPETPYASYGLATRSWIIFYTQRTYKELYGLPSLEQWVDSVAPRTAYVLTRDDWYAQLPADPALASRLEIVGRNPPGVGHDDYLLVRIRPR